MQFSRHYKSVITVLLLVLFDLAAFYSSLILAYYTRKSLNIFFSELIPLTFSLSYFFHFWWMPLTFILFFSYEKIYSKKFPLWDEVRELVKAVIISMTLILAIITIGRLTFKISRLTMIFLWIYSLFLFPLFKVICKKILYKLSFWKEDIIILGAGKAGIDIAKGLNSDQYLGYNVIGFLDDAPEKRGRIVTVGVTKYKIFGKIKHFKKFVKFLNISTVIIAIPSLLADELSRLTNEVQKYTKKIMLVPELKGIALLNTDIYHLFTQQFFLLSINNNLNSPLNRFIKLCFDIMISVILLPLLLPIIGVIGMLIKIDSSGPIFYVDSRRGKNGKPFKTYKFRSMYVDSKERLEKLLKTDSDAKKEWESCFKLKKDPRITKIGEFLRQTSLDELPQIFSVLKGKMSLVGPRPILMEEEDKYHEADKEYYYMVKPGITGLWQISGRSNTDYNYRVKLNTWYVLNWSLWFDIVILLKTIRVVLKREGVY